MIGAGSLPSHARAKRDKPQTGEGEGACWLGEDDWGLGLPSGTPGPCGKEHASLGLAVSLELLEPLPGLSAVLAGNVQPPTPWPRASGTQPRSSSLCAHIHPATDPMTSNVLKKLL